jgi:hypothetical protein
MITIEVEPDQAITIVRSLRAAADALTSLCQRAPVRTIGRNKPRSIGGWLIASLRKSRHGSGGFRSNSSGADCGFRVGQVLRTVRFKSLWLLFERVFEMVADCDHDAPFGNIGESECANGSTNIDCNYTGISWHEVTRYPRHARPYGSPSRLISCMLPPAGWRLRSLGVSPMACDSSTRVN